MSMYQHTLRYSDLANPRPAFQSQVAIAGVDHNLNRTTKRYYSSQDVSIFFGDFYIDDANFAEFEVTESAMLMYGYNSYVFDDIAKGARMVQGRFAINFTQANYLSKVLSDISIHKGTGAITHSQYHALWPSGFDLFIHHGNHESGDLQLVMLQDIYITGCSMQHDAKTGEPSMEIYTFIGKDVKFGAELEQEEGLSPVINSDDDYDYSFHLTINSANDKIVLNTEKTLPITKVAYAFDDSTIYSSKGIEIKESDPIVIITPTEDAIAAWDTDSVHITIQLHIENEALPLIIEETLALRQFNPDYSLVSIN